MKRYLFLRLFFFFPALIIISLLAFIISQLAPGDPVELNVQNRSGAGNNSLAEQRLSQKKIWRNKLGLDLPVFYFRLHALSEPDTLYRVYPLVEKTTLSRLLNDYGNWEAVINYYGHLKKFENSISDFEKTKITLTQNGPKAKAINEIKFELKSLEGTYDPVLIAYKLNVLNNWIKTTNEISFLKDECNNLIQSYQYLVSHSKTYLNYIPCLSFYPYNQYHRWVFGDGNWLTGKGAVFTRGIIRGDFGKSYTTGLPILSELWPRIKWSLLLTVTGILISYLISVPVGILSAARENSFFDRISGNILFLFFSFPVFWIATMLLLLFANPYVLQIFPASGIMPPTGYLPGSAFYDKFLASLPYLVLPLFCYSYGAIAFLSRSLRNSMLAELKQDYIKTARAKGLSEKQVLLKHAFRNAQLPLITLLAGVLPSALSGSVIVEYIFSIPGMGYETIYAIQHQNYPVLIAIFTITGFLSILGYFLADVFYAVADPRISFKKVLV